MTFTASEFELDGPGGVAYGVAIDESGRVEIWLEGRQRVHLGRALAATVDGLPRLKEFPSRLGEPLRFQIEQYLQQGKGEV